MSYNKLSLQKILDKAQWKYTYIICLKKKSRWLPTYKSILFKSTLKSDLSFPRSTYTHATYLFLNATEVFYWSKPTADKQLSIYAVINSLITEEMPGFEYLPPGAVFCIPVYDIVSIEVTVQKSEAVWSWGTTLWHFVKTVFRKQQIDLEKLCIS